MNRVVLACLLGCLWTPYALAAALVVTDAGEVNLGPYVEVLEDPDANFTIEQVSGGLASRFTPSDRDNPSFGFTRSVFWLRVTIDLSAVNGHEWYLIQRHPIVDHLTFYVPEAGGFRSVSMGDALPFHERFLALREFVLPLDEASGARTYYLRVAGKGALSLELKLADAGALLERTYREQLIFGLFFGALIVMLVYNLLLYFSVRERVYLYYIVFLAGYTLSFVNINGLGLQYLWPGLPWLNEHYPLFAGIAMWALLEYSRAFLDVPGRAPDTDRWLGKMVQVSLGAIVAVVVLPAPWSYHVSTLMTLVVVLTLFVVGLRIWREGYTVARLYVLAWSVFLVGCVLFAADNLKLIPHSTLTNYAPHAGGAWVVVLLSLALGDRIKLLESQRDQIKEQAREALERHFREVQQLDRDKMVFLDYLSHELNTPLNWLAGAANLEAENLPEEVQQAVSMVHKGQDRLQRLVATSLRYFDLAARESSPALSHVQPMWIFDGLMSVHKAELARRRIKVTNRVPADMAVLACEHELGVVLSDLFENALAFSPDSREITLLAEIEDKDAIVRICDQGKGIEQDALAGIFEPFFMVGSGHRVDGFGLSLPIARVMVTQMGGQIWAESEGRGKGACLCVRLPLAQA